MILDSAYIVKSATLTPFNIIPSILCRYFTDLLKICIKKFDAVKLFLKN